MCLVAWNLNTGRPATADISLKRREIQSGLSGSPVSYVNIRPESSQAAPTARRINDRDAAERTALIWAVTGTGTPFTVRHTVLAQLVENGADVNATDSNGETAMFSLVRSIDDALALQLGPQCIQILVDAGANRNPVNSAGKTPLAVVRPDNHLVIDLLRNLGFTE